MAARRKLHDMTALSGIFVIVELAGALRDQVVAIQRAHDRRLANLWAPHVTLLGSSGAGPILADTPVDALRAAFAPIAARTPVMDLPFGPPERFPDRDIVALPLDPHGPLRALHEALKLSGVRTHSARYPFTPHCTLTMYPPLTPERERALLTLRAVAPLRIDTLRVVLTREPQPPRLLLELPLGPPRAAP